MPAQGSEAGGDAPGEVAAPLAAALAACEARRQEDHRHFRNMLAVIRVMARHSADEGGSVEDYGGRLDGRLAAYIRVQMQVARDGEVDLEAMLSDELLRFGIRVGAEADLAGRPVAVAGHAAGLLALAFHELAVDLATSGGNPGGRQLAVRWPGERQLAVRWQCDDAGSLTLDWITYAPRPRRGPGVEPRWPGWLDEALRHQLQAETEERVAGDGAALGLHLPADRIPVARHRRDDGG